MALLSARARARGSGSFLQSASSRFHHITLKTPLCLLLMSHDGCCGGLFALPDVHAGFSHVRAGFSWSP